MKRLVIVAALGALCVFATAAVAGDYHNGTTLICSDCHVMHGSQSHALTSGGFFVPLGVNGPYGDLLRNDVNDLCLTCHDNSSFAPDVFGNNGGVARVRNAGALNADPAKRANDNGFDVIDGHTLWSTATAPGGTFTNADGLECTNCHSQHGQNVAQYRNLATSPGGSAGKTVTYAAGTNDLTKDVFEAVPNGYAESQVNYNEPNTSGSAYGAWCSGCHTYYHGSGGSINMGGASGGDLAQGSTSWLRHPTADVNVGWAPTRTYYSSLSQYNGHTNRVKVMDSQGLWNGTAADNTITPSCFSCHKSHGNKNGFGLIFMSGTGTVTEEGDNGTRQNDLCKQCHTQGA
ncbi:MAG TPA: cytochrome c3 family protein [Candidatus Binatia bacterium]|nr:cytochrome c3 family protein [Candidatus Binatia bacterium]